MLFDISYAKGLPTQLIFVLKRFEQSFSLYPKRAVESTDLELGSLRIFIPKQFVSISENKASTTAHWPGNSFQFSSKEELDPEEVSQPNFFYE